MVPVIETARLRLRGFEQADLSAYAAIWQEPEVGRFTGGTLRSLPEIRGRFETTVGHWADAGFGQWAITRRQDGALIGQTGFFRARRDIGADFDAAPEAGWVLSAAAHGQGYGREAADAAHRWFDAEDLGGVSHAMIDLGHEASFALAARLGYRPMREADYLGARVCLLRRETAAWA